MWEQTQVGTSLEGVWDMTNYHGNDWLIANGRNAKFVLITPPEGSPHPIEKLGLVIEKTTNLPRVETFLWQPPATSGRW